MKLVVILLVFTGVQVAARPSDAQKVTLQGKNLSLRKAFREIRKQTDYQFFYKNEFLERAKPIDIQVKNAPVKEALDDCFKDQPFTYELAGKIVVVKEREGFKAPAIQVLLSPVTGTIRDSVTGDPLVGVTIKVKGSDVGTVTNAEGKFSLDVPDDAVLVISYVGYNSKEVIVNGRDNINIKLSSSATSLDQLVVIGYGTKKKADLTGAVGSVGSKQLEKRTVTKASLALQGQVSGISVRQSSGNPTNNNGSLLVRGRGTFSGAGTQPLVLVDGIESSMDNVDPEDIESITVLKDAASAAIYGSKAANGVILIKTKEGKAGNLTISYDGYVGKQKATMLPEMINSWEYAEVINRIDPGRYSESDIQKFKSGGDPNYPNFDHIHYLFGSGKGLVTKHNISASGGTVKNQYMFSFGYFNDQAIIEKNSARGYNFRLSLNSEIANRLKLQVKLGGVANSSKEPSSAYTPGVAGLVLGAMRNSNIIPGPTPDGFWGRNETLHPEADLNSKSFLKNQSHHFYSNAQIVWDIVEGLKITGQTGYTWSQNRALHFQAKYPVTPSYGINVNSLNDSYSQSSALTLRILADYYKSFEKHNFHILGGIESISNDARNISAYRDDFPNNNLYVIDAGATTHVKNGGSAAKHTLASYFGRLNYDFQEKYLFEANVRFDGSSRFPPNDRWGIFPSLSAGWRISQEKFIKDADLPWITNLKIRGSWGRLGNQSIGNYPYQDLLTLGLNYPFGNEMSAGAAVTQVPNKNITWETTTITDVGLDVSLFEEKFNFSIDYYNKVTSDILYNISVSSILGASPAPSNAGEVGNKGWDFNVSYQKPSGKFTYGASALFSIVHNKVLKLANVDKDIAKGLFIGYPIGSSYGYVSDGLFANDKEVENYATQPFSNLATGGGIKFVDLSGPDGKPDGIVEPTYDRRVIGHPLPITTYSLTLNAGYKNFDLYVMFQGEGGRKAPVSLMQFFYPLENQSNIQRIFYENSWTAKNPNPHAEFPKIIPLPASFYNTNPVSFWFRDATFLRLKSMQLGYNLPEEVLNKTFLKKLRVYISAENLFTLTNYYKDWDPEMSTSGSFYPLLRTFSAGINVKF